MIGTYETATLARPEALHKTIAGKTRRVYDVLSGVYPLSTYFFHSKAHRRALQMSGLKDGMRVLEVATGSGEMFRRLIRANPSGSTLGLDLSPRMAARTQSDARKEFPNSNASCQAVDARMMPFRDGQFDAVVCCYLLELLSVTDISMALAEFRRVLQPGGKFTLVLIGQNTKLFNRAYRVCGSIAPAFWGRQIEQSVPEMLVQSGFQIQRDAQVRQGFYPSRVICAY